MRVSLPDSHGPLGIYLFQYLCVWGYNYSIQQVSIEDLTIAISYELYKN